MCLVNKKTILLCIFLITSIVSAQKNKTNYKTIEFGIIAAGSEELYYGGYTKFTIPLSQKKHHFTLALSLAAYFDFEGESEPDAYLTNDIDMRILPTINPGYSLNFNRFQFNFEAPIGLSIATTKGTLINERIGFKRDFSNKETFFNYGLSFSPKFKLNNSNSIGLYGFLPLVNDTAQSGYQMGINWTKTFNKKK